MGQRCGVCASPIEAGWRYCGSCGRELSPRELFHVYSDEPAPVKERPRRPLVLELLVLVAVVAIIWLTFRPATSAGETGDPGWCTYPKLCMGGTWKVGGKVLAAEDGGLVESVVSQTLVATGFQPDVYWCDEKRTCTRITVGGPGDATPIDCRPTIRAALEAAQRYVHDPDEPPSGTMTTEYRPPCMATCQLERKRQAIADEQEAVRLIAAALGCL